MKDIKATLKSVTARNKQILKNYDHSYAHNYFPLKLVKNHKSNLNIWKSNFKKKWETTMNREYETGNHNKKEQFST